MIPPAIALFSFPLFAIILFATQGMRKGLIYGVLVGYLLLPPGWTIDLPGLPPISKDVVISLSLFLGSFAASDRKELKAVSAAPKLRLLLIICSVLIVLGPVMTVLTNLSGTWNGGAFLRALGPRDILSLATKALIALPIFWLARRYLGRSEALRELLVALALSCLVLSLFVLFERRMSPQLNIWIYGYFPHSWAQHFRDGWRPVVFFDHGLSLGLFLCGGVLASAALSRRVEGQQRGLWLCAMLWLLITLFLSRNLGALMIAMLLLPLILFFGMRAQAAAAATIAAAYLIYPFIRSAELLPYGFFLDPIRSFSPARYSSFMTRFVNEDRMLGRAMEQPIFGWGGWSRSRVFNAEGRDITIADGAWVITLGVDGFIGFLAWFGLLAFPLIVMFFVARKGVLTPMMTGVGIITAANLIYLVPNSTLSPVGWILGGALVGALEFGRQTSATADTGPEPTGRRDRDRSRQSAPAYSRFRPDGAPRNLRRG